MEIWDPLTPPAPHRAPVSTSVPGMYHSTLADSVGFSAEEAERSHTRDD